VHHLPCRQKDLGEGRWVLEAWVLVVVGLSLPAQQGEKRVVRQAGCVLQQAAEAGPGKEGKRDAADLHVCQRLAEAAAPACWLQPPQGFADAARALGCCCLLLLLLLLLLVAALPLQGGCWRGGPEWLTMSSACVETLQNGIARRR